jgi:DNA-binding transcriptional LysR family regulator
VDLRSLRYFVAVVEHGGITPAAAALFVSQPSLSQAMRSLEAELGAELLDRTGRRATPTAAGVRLLALARQVLGEADGAVERVRQVAALDVGRLVVATSTSLSVHPLTDLVGRLRAAHPALEVHVRDGRTPAGVLAMLKAGQAEMGVTEVPLAETGWSQHELDVEEIVLVTSPALGRALGERITHDEVAELPIGVVPADLESSGPTALSLDALVGRPRALCAHRVMLWELVRSGTVASFVGRRTAEQVLPWARLHSLDPPLHRRVALVWRSGAISPAGAALVACARHADERPGEGREGRLVEEQADGLLERRGHPANG